MQMQRVAPIPAPWPVFFGAVGLAVGAALVPWLNREFDVPYALQANGATGTVL